MGKFKELKQHDYLTIVWGHHHDDLQYKIRSLLIKMPMCDEVVWKKNTMDYRIAEYSGDGGERPAGRYKFRKSYWGPKHTVLRFEKGKRDQVLQELSKIQLKRHLYFDKEPANQIKFAEMNVFDQIAYRDYFRDNGLGPLKDIKDNIATRKTTVIDDLDKCKDYLPKLKRGRVYRSTQSAGSMWTGNISVSPNAVPPNQRRAIQKQIANKLPPELEYTVRTYRTFIKKKPLLDFWAVLDDAQLKEAAHNLVEQLIPGFNYKKTLQMETDKIKEYNYHLEQSGRQTRFPPDQQNNNNAAYVHNTKRLQADEEIKLIRKQLGKAKSTVTKNLKKFKDKNLLNLHLYSLI
jgi:hypothetical protein